MNNYIRRKSLLYQTGVEYGDYCINHVQGCAHGCRYPCYAMMMARRFGKISSYEEWLHPFLVENALELLKKELPRYKHKIKSVHFCFTTDPFMYGYEEVSNLTLKLLAEINRENIPCIVLTKGVLPIKLAELGLLNEVGISLVSLNEKFRQRYEPFSAPFEQRLNSLLALSRKGLKTWVSIEPYPTPNIVSQDVMDILKAASFVDKIVFGRLNYNPIVTRYHDRANFYNEMSLQVMKYCQQHDIQYHIKEGTLTQQVAE